MLLEQFCCQKLYECQNDIAACPSICTVLRRLQPALGPKARQKYIFYVILWLLKDYFFTSIKSYNK